MEAAAARPMNAEHLLELPFPPCTYERRLLDVQAALRGQGLAGALLFDPENIFWLCGYQSTGRFASPCLFVPEQGEAVLLSRKSGGSPAAAPALGRFVEIGEAEEPTDVLARFLDETFPAETGLGVETGAGALAARELARLQTRLPRVRLSDWAAHVEARRIRKSAEEIERMRTAARAAEAGLDAALAAIAPGKTENDVAAAMYAASIGAGSEYLGHPPLVVSGARTALRYATWRRRAIQPGDVVRLEAGGCAERYHAVIGRSAVVGKPAPLQKQAADALMEALDALVTAIAPGRTSGEVDAAGRGVVEEAGLGHALTHHTGRSLGIGFPPGGSEGRVLSIRPHDATVLEPGMTFHLAPALFFEDFGMGFSETVLVTDDGCDVLTDYLRRLFVIDAG